jgi:hypothetical protein
MERFDFWQKWLFIVSLLITAFGVFMACCNATSLFDLFNQQIDPVFWGSAQLSTAASNFQAWVYAVWGSTVAGWGIFLAFIAYYPFKQKEIWAWNCLVSGLLLWYLLDTGFSLYYQVVFNAIFNTLLLMLVIPPLGMTYRNFYSSKEATR